MSKTKDDFRFLTKLLLYCLVHYKAMRSGSQEYFY